MGERREFLAHIHARRDQVAENVRDQIRTAAYWNRLHPDERPIDVDDEDGTLARSLRTIGLDLEMLRIEALSSALADEDSSRG